MVDVNMLAVSVGNSRTRMGAFVDGKLTESATYLNRRSGKLGHAMEQAFQLLHDCEDVVVLMSSVNGRDAEAIENQLSQQFGHVIKHAERDLTIPIGRQLDPEAIVGEDRLLNAAAAYDVLRQACVVIDAGTAITVDFVDGAGTFHGGAIAAGAQLMLDSLHRQAWLLPEVEFDRPVECIGHNTIEAMRAGVFHGLRGMARELAEHYAEKAGTFPAVLATGGDAALLFRDYDLVDRVVPDLTLMGLAVTLRVAMEGGSD